VVFSTDLENRGKRAEIRQRREMLMLPLHLLHLLILPRQARKKQEEMLGMRKRILEVDQMREKMTSVYKNNMWI
jgi:hypothetical protein